MAEQYPQRGFIAPADATTLLLVRHGASQAAVEGKPFALVGGHADPPLAPAGEQQALKVAERLAGEPVDRIFVTTLQRTVQTAAPLAARLGIEPEVVEDLREVNLGEWEGGEFRIRAHKGDPLVLRMLSEERWDLIPGSEPMQAFAERVGRGLEHVIAASGPGKLAVVVVHGGVIGEICRQITDCRPFSFVHADNCSITKVVAFANGRRLVRGFNDVAHL